MSTFSGYKTKAFSPTQKFFVLDPNTGSPSFVQGSDLVAQLTPNSSYVFSESTRTTAQATDYELGAVIQTGGATAVGDNQAGVYLVVAAGEGDFPMDNGNELLELAGDDSLREQLAENTAGNGSDLVAHTGTTDTVTESLNKRTIYVGSVAAMEALSLPAGTNVYLTDVDKAGEFSFDASNLSTQVTADTAKGVYIAPASAPTGTSGAWVRREIHSLNARWFGGSESNTIAQNRTALQAAISLAEFLGGGFVDVPYGVDYGLINNDATTQPDFGGLTNDIVVIDDSRADADGSARKAGAQRRIFCHTAQTSPEGQHNGNGFRVFGDWAPYYWLENNAQYAAQGDPSRTAADNRRGSLFFANDGAATWRVGQGTQIGDLSDEDMSNFVIEAFGTSEGTYVPMLVQRATGNVSYGGGTNVPSASHHFKSVSPGVASHMVESLGTTTTTVLRNSNGSADDIQIRNVSGAYDVFVPAVGAALTVTRADRRVRIENLLTLPQKAKASFPAAGTYTASLIYCTDATGGAAPAYSNGTNWISLLTGNPI